MMSRRLITQPVLLLFAALCFSVGGALLVAVALQSRGELSWWWGLSILGAILAVAPLPTIRRAARQLPHTLADPLRLLLFVSVMLLWGVVGYFGLATLAGKGIAAAGIDLLLVLFLLSAVRRGM